MTPFAKKVYKAVLSIPLGEVRTYEWVAKKCGSPGAARAVGSILRKNPYPLIIPCHRVIKSNSELGGYSFGGVKNKTILLESERKILLCIKSKEGGSPVGERFNPTGKKGKMV